MKAYTVYDGDDGWEIVFAKTNVEARRVGANRLDRAFNEIDSCKRSPHLDAYAPGPVPPKALIESGWHFECGHCGDTVSSDSCGDDGEAHSPAYDGDMVYCCAEHRAMEWAERRRQSDRDHALIEAAVAEWPEVVPMGVGHTYLPGGAEKPVVYFKFPGSAGQASWTLGEKTIMVDQRDVDAWHAYRGSSTKEEA